jgi:hypothetical protein
MNLQSFMQYLVSLQPAYRQAGFKVSITTNQKPFEQPTQKAFLHSNTEGGKKSHNIYFYIVAFILFL